MMSKQQLQQQKKQLQIRLVVWIVMTISFYIMQIMISWAILMYVAWMASLYCLILFGLLIRIEWLIYRY